MEEEKTGENYDLLREENLLSCYSVKLQNEKATRRNVAFQIVLITLSALFFAGYEQKEIFNCVINDASDSQIYQIVFSLQKTP
jgi:hypothetical protein